MKPSYAVKKKRVVYQKGPIRILDALIRMPQGITLSRQILDHPGAVVIIPQLSGNEFILVRQFRFAACDHLWEWPAGGIERGENLLQCARRELMEEAGFRPLKLKRLCSFYPTPGVSNERMHLFLAKKLVPASAIQDEDEAIEIGIFGLKEIGKMVRSGKIQDAKTLLGYYLLKEML